MSLAVRVHAPARFVDDGRLCVFLAGVLGDWREEVVRDLQDLDVVIFDPVRKDWDSTWVESVDDVRFVEQTLWEFWRQAEAGLVLFYFGSAEADGVVTMMEFGLWAGTGRAVVLESPDFRKWGYIRVICGELGVKIVRSVKEFRQFVVETC